MPRVHFVKSARKDNPVAKAGESYYWWKFRHGGKRYSLTPPKPWQLTQSPYLQQLYLLQDRQQKLEAETFDQLDSEAREIADEIRSLGEECQDSLDNIPEPLQEGDTGQLLQERIDAAESAASEIENILDSFDEHAEDMNEALENAIEEIKSVDLGG